MRAGHCILWALLRLSLMDRPRVFVPTIGPGPEMTMCEAHPVGNLKDHVYAYLTSDVTHWHQACSFALLFLFLWQNVKRMGHRTERFPFEKGLVTGNTVPRSEHSRCHKEAWGQRAAPGHCELGSGAKGSELKCLLAKMGRIHSKTVLSYLFVPFSFFSGKRENFAYIKETKTTDRRQCRCLS